MDYRKPSKTQSNEIFLQTIRKSQGNIVDKAETIEKRKLFLIVCEGKNTEPSYFEGFPIPGKIVLIEGGRASKTSLVDYAIKIKDNEENEGREIWCVFDYDIKPDEALTQPQDFNNAISKAYAHGMHVAWSNDAFELWFVLHYLKIETHCTREKLFEILKDKWALKSFKNEAKVKIFCEGHYKRHGGYESAEQELALKYAESLHLTYKGRQDFANHCPCTTVYLLVNELNKHLKK